MEEKLLIILNSVLDNAGKSKIQTLNPATNLRNDLGFDSLNLAELTVKIEDEFDVDIFENEIVNTVGEIMAILKSKAA